MGRKSNATTRRNKAKPTELAFYEGLVRKTASIYEPLCEEEFDDIAQVLRMTVWRALTAYNPARSRLPLERFVFSCVKNRCKDLVRKRRRNELYIEDVAPAQLEERSAVGERSTRDRFEARYLSADDTDFDIVEAGMPTIPSTLTAREREVVALLYLDFSQREAMEMLGIRRNEMERSVRQIRVKMADWKPAVSPAELPVAA